jgi:hypothetical protein
MSATHQIDCVLSEEGRVQSPYLHDFELYSIGFDVQDKKVTLKMMGDKKITLVIKNVSRINFSTDNMLNVVYDGYIFKKDNASVPDFIKEMAAPIFEDYKEYWYLVIQPAAGIELEHVWIRLNRA